MQVERKNPLPDLTSAFNRRRHLRGLWNKSMSFAVTRSHPTFRSNSVGRKVTAAIISALAMLIGALWLPVPAAAGQVACTPSAGYTNCVVVTYSGANQTITVPAGISKILAKVWGAAGGGGNSTYYNVQANGGAGGFATGVVTVTPGSTLNLTVGQGGLVSGTTSTFGGGGGGGATTAAANEAGSSGGGLSGVWVGAPFTTGAAAIVAGGGGGSSPGADTNTPLTGGGGGLTGGQDTMPTLSGRGGTQAAGGAPASGTWCAASGSPTAGSQFLGGAGAKSTGYEAGGGGGSGYFGGGGGNCQEPGWTEPQDNGDGGGGSSFLSAALVTGGSTTAGANGVNPAAGCTGTTVSGGAGDPFFTAGIGSGSCFANGGNGQIVLEWLGPKVTLTKVSSGGVGAFTFTGTNGWTSQTITTVTSGTAVSGAAQTLAAAATATTITEAIPVGYLVTAISCTGLGTGGTATPDLAGGAVALDAAATVAGANIACTFTNTKIPTVSIAKVSNGGVGTFTFATTNLASASTSVTTVTAGTAVSAAPTAVTTIGTAVTAAESLPAGWALSGASCLDANRAITGNPATFGSVAGSTLTIPAANVVAGAAIACTFTDVGADMSITLAGLPTTASVGVAYSGTFTCSNAAAPAVAATAATCGVSGLPAGLTTVCAPVPPVSVAPGGSILCTVSGTPTAAGSSTLAGTTGATNDVNAANNTTAGTITTTGSDMTPDLSGLPAAATVGTAYSGTVKCTNAAGATAAAANATCALSGLPPGVTVGACSPTPPATVAAGASISCPVSGTPTASGATTVSVTTGATNDTNGGATAGGNNTATKTITATGSDMAPDLSGLPATIQVGVAYTGTVKCTNSVSATASAMSAACAVTGLPAGVTVGACVPAPPATVAPGASISCPVSGTPTSPASSTVTVTTGAPNDTNGGTTSGGNNSASVTLAPTSSDMSVNVAGLPTTASIGVPYSGTFVCSNANAPAIAATNAGCGISGLPAGLTTVCAPVPPVSVAPGAVITCTVSGTPTAVGNAPLTASTGASNDPNLANNTATTALNVTGSDMAPDLSGLPAVATVGVPYSGTIRCTNAAGSTAAAINASCAITGLPPGVTAGTCAPTPPATIAAGASISCPVAGTPTASGTTTATVTTGATNDTNGGTGSGGNNTATAAIATASSDMSVSLAGLPTTASIGVPYSGTYTCSNAVSPAIAATGASCAVSNLPAGLTATCAPTPPTTVAPGAKITCTVSGTPTTVATPTITGTTGASNDADLANNTATATIAVSGADMTPDLSGLPTTVAVGSSYTGTLLCTNNAASTASATNATCSISGLPAGVTVGTCAPLPPATVAAGASISCPVSGTPTSAATTTVTATTGATNDANGGTTTGGNNTATLTLSPSGSDMTIDVSALPTTASIGVPYTGTFTCSNATAPAVAATAAGCAVSGLPAGLTTTCSPTPPATVAPGGSISCSVSGTPTVTGNAPVTGTTGAANDAVTSNNTGTTSINVTGSDMTPDLSGLPATLTVGTAYSGTILCTNSATATASATNATCAISGLPAGLTVGACSPAAPATVPAAQSISCPISGTPTSTGPSIVTVTTGAVNDTNGGTGTGGNNSATAALNPAASDMSIDLSGLPTSSGLGQPYTGSYSCTNATSPAIAASAASCAVGTLPAGLTATCSPATPATVAPGGAIICAVSGTPTAVGSTTVNGTTGATNDGNPANNASTTVIAIATPSLTVAKSASASSFAAPGLVITYSYVVTNSGTVSVVSAVTLSDNKIATVSCPSVPTGGLAPGATLTCTGAYTTTQADVDAGGVTNIASARSGSTTSSPTSLTVPAIAGAGLSIVKSTTTTAYSAVSAPIVYTYKVTNSGNTTLTSTVTVADNKIASVTCPSIGSGLAPGASITCSGTYTTTQADIDAGAVTNIATASSGATNSPTASVTINATQSPGLSIAKNSTTTSFATAGTIIPYSYKLTNNGNTTLTTAVTVSDNKIATVTCPSLPIGGLAPGANIVCFGSYTTTQADIDAGGITNIASAKSGTASSPTTSLTVPAIQTPSMTVAKSSTTTSFNAPGVVIPYSYTVTNTGNATLTSAISVSDNKIASISCPSIGSGLAPGASITCTGNYTTAQADVDAGGVTNIASSKSGTTASPPTSLKVLANQTPSIGVAKSASPTSFSAPGAAITYSYVVTNTGNTTIAVTPALAISDNKIAAVTCPAIPTGGLAPGATLTCSATAVTTQADVDAGSIVNTATASGGGLTSSVATATVTATQTPALSLVKSTATGSFASVGVAVPYTFTVTNNGNTTFKSAITVSDSKIAAVSCPALSASGLAPSASIACTGSYTTTQSDIDAGGVTNTASATSGSTTSPLTSHTLPSSQFHALTMTKSASPTTFSAPGAAVSYSYVVKNTGNITLPAATTISVTDNKLASISCPPLPVGGLAPGATVTCSASYSTQQSDLDAGSITNIASATDGTATSPSATATVTGLQSPSLAIAKATTATTYSAVGVTIPYTFKVTNTGNITLTSAVTVADSKIAAVACPSIGAGLSPANSITCTGNYVTTQADIDAGSIINVASAKSGATTSPTGQHTLPAAVSPALTVAKSSTTANFSAPGVVIPYSYKVTNSGNVTFTAAISVSDNKIASVSCPALSAAGLAPGAFITCSGTYTTTQADVDAGGVTNSAAAASGSTTSPSVGLTVPAAQTPQLSLIKASGSASFATVGQSIPYTFNVVNSGNTTLTTAVTIADPLITSVTCPALPIGGLAPAAAMVCTGAYTVTQSDLDAGGVTNTATTKSGALTSPSSSVTVPAVPSPALSIVKSSTSTAFTATGTLIPYTFNVTNTGNVTLKSAITVSDSKIASVLCPSIGSGLAPGAAITCTASYTTSQADVDAGGVTNTASASSGAATSPLVSLTVTSTRTPALSIVKSTSATTYATVGQLIPYSYAVTNSGNTTLTTAVSVSDSKIASVSCPSIGAGIVPGASITCTGSYTITQNDLDGGNVVNTASAKSGVVISPMVTYTLTGTQTPKMTITKASSTTSITTLNQVVPYSFSVTNTGNVTLTSQIAISDSKIGSVTCPPIGAGLAVGASTTCTANYTVTQADLDAGSVVNTASATSGTVISNTTALTISVAQSPALSMIKSAPPAPITTVGQIVTYSFAVTNSGNVTLTTPITISDNKIASVSCPAMPPMGLAPGAGLTCTGTYTVTQADLDGGGVVNTAVAKSGPSTSTPPQVHTQTAGQTHRLSLIKSPSTPSVATLGASVSYTYAVTNNGNITVPATATISVSDNKIAAVSCPAVPAAGLAPGASLTCTAAYTITQADLDAGSVTNTATATDGTATSPPVSATVTATQSPALAVTKSTTTSSYAAVGTVVPYSFVVKNTGNVTMTSAITVVDSRIAAVTCPSIGAGLAPGASITCTGGYTTTQADLDAGSVVNTATAKSGTTSSPIATHSLPAAQSRALSVAKSASPSTVAATGTTINYSYVVTNSGNITISSTSSVSITDNKLASVSCPPLPAIGLAPTKTITCTAAYVTTQADIDAGSISNTASATDGIVTSQLTSTTVTATQSPGMSVVKNTTATVYNAVGNSIPYTFVVTNTGNTTLTSAITTSDNKIAAVSCPSVGTGLKPTASITCTGTYTITQADLDSGSVVNTAFSKAGTTTSTPPVNHVLNGSQTAALTLIKSTTSTGFSATGVTIPYSYKVTNTGNVTLTSAIIVTDNKIATVTCPALPIGGLLPANSITCTGNYVTSQADIDAGKVVNTAAAASGSTVSPSVNVTLAATQSPALTIAKATTTTTFSAAGTVIPYTYRVTNAGNVTLSAAISIADNKIATVTCPALPVGGLAPGASITCLGTYTATQIDVDAGKVTNVATASSGTTTSPVATATVNATQSPALSIAKSSPTTSFAAPGLAISYAYKVTNTGNVTLATAISVSDDKIASVVCPALPVGGLVPGTSITCTGSYTTTQADVDAGTLVNNASAKSGSTTSAKTSLTIAGSQSPALTIVKSSTATTFSAAGTSLPYAYKITNSGNITLTSAITVADNKIALVSCPSIGSGLAPGGSVTCTGAYITKQADVDAGQVTNTASAKSGTVLSSLATLSIGAAQTPGLTIAKSTTSASFAAAGSTIPYSYKVTNSGNTTLTTIVTVADNKIASVSCPALPVGGLAPATFIMCTGTYVTTQADVDAGAVVNIASAKSGAVTSPQATVSVASTQSPALVIVKSSTMASFATVGISIPYSYKVTNSGNVTLTTAIAVSDNKIPAITCPALPAGGLAPMAFITCSGPYMTTQADLDAGHITNIARASSGATISLPTSLTIVATQAPALAIAKTSPATTFSTVGTVIPYAYKVTNNGNTTLTTAITVSDNKIASVTCPALPAGGLAPGGSVTCVGSYTITQADLDAGSVSNSASAKTGLVVSPTVSLTINATLQPALSLVKSSTATTYASSGAVIAYSYIVTNAGNTTLTAPIAVSDNKIVTVACPALPAGGLVPKASITCTANYTVTQADLNVGTLTNIASAKSGTTLSPTTSLTIKGTSNANFSIAQTAIGSLATNNGNGTFTGVFDIVLLNTGNVDLTALQISDNFAATLPPGAILTATAINSVTSSTRGALTSANATFDGRGSNPNLLVPSGEAFAVGETITIAVSVTFNPGSNPSGTVFPNIAVGTSSTPSGVGLPYKASKAAQAAIPFVQAQALVATKTTPQPDITVGSLVPYTIALANGTALTRTGVTVVDQIPAGFTYRAPSATINGVATAPVISGRQLSWPNQSIPAGKSLTIKVILIAGAGLKNGEFTNQAWAADGLSGTVISNIATATVRMIGDPTFDCTDIIGKVFIDTDRSGYADDGKRGIANVRLATARGQLITTDSEGRYHIACADIPTSDRGTNFILKLDARTLPTGYRTTTENPRVIRITAGKMAKINFGAAIGRVARLDLADAAFEVGTTHLKPLWNANIGQVLAALKAEKTVLRIAYRRLAKEDNTLAEARVAAIAAALRRAWSDQGAVYSLEIETEVFTDGRARQ